MIYFGNCVFLFKLQFLFFCFIIVYTIFFFLLIKKKPKNYVCLTSLTLIVRNTSDLKKKKQTKEIIRPEKVFRGM